jgi:hypothetical protein
MFCSRLETACLLRGDSADCGASLLIFREGPLVSGGRQPGTSGSLAHFRPIRLCSTSQYRVTSLACCGNVTVMLVTEISNSPHILL